MGGVAAKIVFALNAVVGAKISAFLASARGPMYGCGRLKNDRLCRDGYVSKLVYFSNKEEV